MKKVLIVTYYWPPSGGGGVQRWLKFVKYLRDFGWEPIVYTPRNPEAPQEDFSLLSEIPEGITVLKTPVWEPYQLYKKFTGRKADERIQTAFLSEKKKPGLAEQLSIWIRGNLFIPDARRFWIKPSVKFLKKWLEENPVDALVTTGPPHSMHLIGKQLHNLTKIPWLADFRDPWTNIDYYHDLMLGKRADRRHHLLERSVLEQAGAVVVISNGMRDEFEQIVSRDYAVIPNGFDQADFPQHTQLKEDQLFSLAHIGSLVKTRNPVILWKVLQKLLLNEPGFREKLQLKLIGKTDVFVRQSIEEYGLSSFVKELDYLPHDQVIAEQCRSQVLLLLINNTPNAHLIVTGKLFEYLASKRPIICIGPENGDAAAILNQTKAGKVSGFEEEVKLEAHIKSYFEAYQAGQNTIDSAETARFERKNLTMQMAQLLDELINRSKSG